MSAEALRKAAVEEIEELNMKSMNQACNLRPSHQSTADGIALFVVDNLAQARAYAQCVSIINRAYTKLVTPPPGDEPKPKIQEVY